MTHSTTKHPIYRIPKNINYVPDASIVFADGFPIEFRSSKGEEEIKKLYLIAKKS
jgi:hypothetical protein